MVEPRSRTDAMSLVETRFAKSEADSAAEGIHIEDPTARELQEAIEEAEAKGFSTVWIEPGSKQS